MSDKPRKTSVIKPLPLWKKALFAAAATGIIVLLLEGILAVFGVSPMRFERDPYVGFSAHVPLFVSHRDLMVTAENKRRIFNYQQFPATKAKNAYRIFCIGGSTTYGHPYTDSTSFCGWLRAMLPRADPLRSWELINCGGVSYASYREALLMEELVKYQPDLFIILTGHNEFLEQRTYGELKRRPEIVRDADLLLSKTRSYSALKRVLQKDAAAVLSTEVDAILDHTVGPQAYHRDEQLRQRILEHFRFNLTRMVDIARSAGAEVILVTPAVNLRNCAPFKSEHRAGITPAETAEWQKLVRHATQQHRTTNWAEAVSALQQATRIDPRFADGHYLLAHALWELKRFDEARAAFRRALDEDVCPLRALPEMTAAMREVAAQQRVKLVDFTRLLETKSPYGVPGDDWFLDHVHPTIEGHRILAAALLESISHPLPQAAHQEIRKSVESTLTPNDHGTALCTLAKVIAWAGKDAEAHRIALRARALAPDDAAVHFEVGKNAARIGRTDEAILALKHAVSLRTNFAEAKALLGSTLMDAGQTEEALRSAREAVELRADDARLRLVFAGLLSRASRLEEAAAQCRETLRLNGNSAEAHNTLAWLLKEQRDFTESLNHFREAVRLRPGLTPAMMGLAWMLATHPDADVREPREAIRLAERVVQLSPPENWMAFDTLAAALASAGRFPEAVNMQRKALEAARAIGPKDVPALEARLMLYERGTPFVER